MFQLFLLLGSFENGRLPCGISKAFNCHRQVDGHESGDKEARKKLEFGRFYRDFYADFITHPPSSTSHMPFWKGGEFWKMQKNR